MKKRIFAAIAVVAGVSIACGVPAAAAAGKCQLVRVAQWPIRIDHDHLLIDGAINGQKIGVMLDTGTMRTMILRSAALRLNLPRQTVAGARLFGAGGETDAESAFVEEIRIGDASRKAWNMAVAGEHDFGGIVDVVLGEDFFSRFDVEFDIPRGTVTLFQPKDCEARSLAYWAKDGGRVVDIEPIDESRPQIVLTVNVNGHAVRALLDSGASTSVVNKNHAFDAGVTPQTPGVVAVADPSARGKRPDLWVGPFATVAIGDELIRDTSLAFTDMYASPTYTPIGGYLPKNSNELKPMLLGVDFLRTHRVLVSHSQRRMYFTYAGGIVFGAPGRSEPPRSDAKPAPGR
jgi:predicted aspartyl protease